MAWLVPRVISGLLGKRWFTATDSGAERRNSQRQPSDEASFNLEWRDDKGEWRVEPADACDESKNGLGLLTEFRFRPGQVVYVLREEAKPLQASVCHSRLAGESYQLLNFIHDDFGPVANLAECGDINKQPGCQVDVGDLCLRCADAGPSELICN